MALSNKKGMFFTLVAIALLSLFWISFSVYSYVQDRSDLDSRIESMNRYVFSLQEDLTRKIFISGFRIIFIHEKRIAQEGLYVANISSSFEEAFFNGTIDGEIKSDEQTLIQGVVFDEILSDINESASKVNLIVNFSNPEISISQTDPWNLKIVLRGNLEISDRGGLASWNNSEEVVSFVPISYFEDPIYLINTNGQVPRKFNKTIYSPLVFGTNVSNLTAHVNGKYYLASNLAPSFLNRLQGNFSANENGIESLVYLPDLAAQGISLQDKSIVDYIYFSSENPTKSAILGMPSWFKIDSAHYNLYNVSGILV